MEQPTAHEYSGTDIETYKYQRPFITVSSFLWISPHDSSSFLNWSEDELPSESEKVDVFRSLVATVKLQPALDVSLEAKAVKFTKYVVPVDKRSTDSLLRSFASNSDESSRVFVQSIGVLISSASPAMTSATIKMVTTLSLRCSAQVLFALVKADLIPQLINTLNPQSLPFSEAVNIHRCLFVTLPTSVRLAAPHILAKFETKGHIEHQAVSETVLQHVLVPSEKYTCHLCVNRFSIIDGTLSQLFLTLLARLLEISPYYPPTMDFVLHMPVVLTIPSCLTFAEDHESIWVFLYLMVDAQREWTKTRGLVQQMGKIVFRMLRMEGIEDAIEEKLRNDQDEFGGEVVSTSIRWSNEQSMNLPRR